MAKLPGNRGTRWSSCATTEAGDLSLQMFAADLYEVLMRRGKQPVYEKPESFFA